MKLALAWPRQLDVHWTCMALEGMALLDKTATVGLHRHLTDLCDCGHGQMQVFPGAWWNQGRAKEPLVRFVEVKGD